MSASQTKQLYVRLRAAVLSLELTPGQRLTERGLESMYGASRTPARAALMRLETEGLVRREGRGWIVAPIDLAEIHAVAEYREAIETSALRLSVERASDRDIAALFELLEAERPADEDEGVRSGSEFHVELARLAGNPLMVEAVGSALTRLARARWLEVRTAAARDRAWTEHRQILDALAARQVDDGVRVLTTHIRSTNRHLIECLEDQDQVRRITALSVVRDLRPGG